MDEYEGWNIRNCGKGEHGFWDGDGYGDINGQDGDGYNDSKYNRFGTLGYSDGNGKNLFAINFQR